MKTLTSRLTPTLAVPAFGTDAEKSADTSAADGKFLGKTSVVRGLKAAF